MRVAVANLLDMFVHVLALRQSPLSVEIVISTEKHFSLVGTVVGQAHLQPGTALSMSNFDDRTRFSASLKGFEGQTVETTLREWRDDEHGECITLTLQRRKPTDTSAVH